MRDLIEAGLSESAGRMALWGLSPVRGVGRFAGGALNTPRDVPKADGDAVGEVAVQEMVSWLTVLGVLDGLQCSARLTRDEAGRIGGDVGRLQVSMC